MSCADLFLAIIAILFPPVAVWIKSGLCTADSLINIALCCLGYLPGLIHAWYIIAKYPEYEYDGYEPIRGDPEQGHGQSQSQSHSGRRGERVTYYYVTHAPGTGANQGGPPPQQQQQQRSYGATAQQQGQQEGGNDGAATSNGQARPPPTYAEAVRGDNKIQTQD